jgi:microcystin-dependent protein
MSRNYSSISEPKTLTADVSSVATQITLNNVTGLPSVPYVLVLNPDTASEEVILVTTDQTGVTSPTVKVSRAIETGASAKTHTNGDTVKHMIVGTDLQIVHDHVDNTTTAHGATGAVVGTTNTQTLTNKTLTSPKINENVALTATATELNVLDGITASTTELNYVDGVTSSIQTQLTANATPAGVVSMWVTDTAPTGWLLCQGQAVSRTTYATLFGVISTTYGVGDNSTTFNLPDLRGRVPMGAGTGRNVADSANLTARTLGAKISDAETVTLTQGQLPSFSHEIQMSSGGGDGTTYVRGSSGAYSTSLYYTHGSGEAHNNTQPSTVINFIIKH